MSDETRLIGEVKRDGTLLYELTMVDCPHGRQAEANRWEAGVGSVMRACSVAEREQIAERLRVAANAFEPMRAALVFVQWGIGGCVSCGGVKSTGHEAGCKVAAALRAAGVEPKP